MKITLIGAGRLGGALTIALAQRGFTISNIVSKSFKSAARLADLIAPRPQSLAFLDFAKIDDSNLFLIAAPDPEISVIADSFAANQNLFKPQTFFLHTSGSLSSQVLASLRFSNNRIGSLHPLVSVSDPLAGAASFKNAYFCVEGDAEAAAAAKKIVTALEGYSFTIPTENKPLYHAAAVITAGHAVTLFDLAIQTLADCGLGYSEAHKILLPLLVSTTRNLTLQTPAAALTGTFARADVETLVKHLEKLKGKPAEKVYREIGKHSLKLAAAQNANQAKLQEMARTLEDENAIK